MTRVKICGITNLEDALAAVEAGADMIGFVFYPPSPRYVKPERVRDIVRLTRRSCRNPNASFGRTPNARPGAGTRIQGSARWDSGSGSPTQFVGVFVNERTERVREIMDECELDLVQFHGTEPPEMVKEFSPSCYQAIRPVDASNASVLLERYREALNGNVPAFIVDAFTPTLFGGSGERSDWTIAHTIGLEFPILLAGGLTPENVNQAVAQVKPWGVDVSSGVERSPGLKDHAKVKRFIENVKEHATVLS